MEGTDPGNESNRKIISVTDASREELLAYALKQLATLLDANGVWIGLPEVILELSPTNSAVPLSTLLGWLPASAQQQLSQSQECLAGEGFSAPAAQIGAMILPEVQPGRFWVAAPIPLEARPHGWLITTHNRPVSVETLDQAYDHLLTLIITTIEHNLYRQAISQYRCSMETLHTVSLRMASTLDLQEVLNLLALSSLEIFPADSAHIFIYSGVPDAPVPYTLGAEAWREASRKPVANQPLPVELLKLVAGRSWPLTIENVQQHPLYSEMQACGCSTGSLVAYPLSRQGRLVGIYFVHFAQPHTPTPEERYMLSLFTDQSLVAIENARTAQAMSYQLAELAALQRMAQKITITLQPEQILEILVQALHSLLNASAVSIMLVDDTYTLRRTALAGDAKDLPDPETLKPGEGYAGRTVLSGKPTFQGNIQGAAPASHLLDRVRSLYVYPIKLQNRITGVLTVTSTQPNSFGPDAERLLSITSAQAAIALENARLYQLERRRADEMQTLMDLSQLITQHLDQDHIFEAAHHAISHLMNAEAFVIAIRDRQTSEVVMTYVIDKGVRYPEVRRTSGKGLSEYVIRTGETVLIEDMENQQLPFERIRFGSQEPVRSILAVPLVAGGQPIGMVAAESYKAAVYTQHDIYLLQSISNAIATAVENAQLFTALEQRFETLQELEHNRLEFIQNVSHELRNPLTFLKAYIDLLLAGEMGQLTQRQHDALNVVSDKTNVLTRLVNDIATLQIDPQHLVHLEETDLIRIVRNAILLAQETASAHRMRIVLDLPESLPLIPADGDRIAQVVDNLLSNAIKFGYPDNQVLVNLKALPDSAQLSVTNQGNPISPENQEKLFQRFFQANYQIKGLGLGLAIVRHIIEAHHGRVWFESVPVQGGTGASNTFAFVIPYQQPRETAS